MRFFLFISLIFCFKTAIAQEPMHYIVGKEELDGVHLYSILQDDKDNSIWITSNKGLHNYDGRNFSFQIPKDCKNSALFGLVKDNKGFVYCFNLNGQVFRITEKKAFLFYTVPKKYLKDGMHIVFDNLNHLIFRIGNQLLTINQNGKLIQYQSETGYSMIKDQDEVYYIKAEEEGIVRKKADLVKLKDGIEENVFTCGDINVNSSYTFPQGFLVKIKDKFYGFHDPEKYVFNLKPYGETQFKHSYITSRGFRVYYSNKNLWFCDYKNGVYKVPEEDIEKPIHPQKWFEEYYISSVITDSEGNTWLLTFEKGIIVIPKSPLNVSFFTVPKKTFKSITKADNKIYIGTSTNEIYTLENERLKLYKSFEEAKLEWLKIYPKKNITLTNTRIFTPEKIYKGGFTKNAILLNDTIYSATIKGFKVQYRDKTYNLSNKRSLDIAYDKKQNSFLLSTIGGAYLYRNKKEKPFMHNGKHLYTWRLGNIEEDIWAVTANGIYIINNEKVIDSLTIKDGLSSSPIFDFRYKKPFVYFTSSNGIQRYNTETKTFKSITKSDGLVKGISQFEVINSTIYALNSDGLISFNFNDINQDIKKYQTVITDAVVNGTTQISNNAILNPEQNNLEFSFLTTTYTYPKGVSYSYQLIGFEKEPTKSKENQNFVKYSNLPAGTYTFKVDSYIKDNKNIPASITFTIKEYWYQSIIFKIIVIIFSLLIIYIIYRFRINSIEQKREKEALRKRLAESTLTSLKAQMNPHFIFNTLNSIQDLVIVNDVKGSNKYLGKFSDLIRKILLSSKEQFISLSEELEMLQLYLDLEKLRFGHDFSIQLKCNIPTTKQTQIKLPALFIQPYVENAIKHGLLHKKGLKILNIEYFQESNNLKCIIEDNGIGRYKSAIIREKKRHASFSTGANKERIRLLNETLHQPIVLKIEDLYDSKNNPVGTRVSLSFPILN